jgi:hypothetical protein
MTANELAIELKDLHLVFNTDYEICYQPNFSSLFNDSADMLCQQEQKIAELEKDLFMLQKHYDQLCEDCTCQGGHSEAYLKAKGKL